MKIKSLGITVIGLTLIGIVMGLAVSRFVTAKVEPTTANSVGQTEQGEQVHSVPPFKFETSYAAVPFEDMVQTADVIVAGSVVDISKTKWNQDSGEYWEQTLKDDVGETRLSAIPYYEVTIIPKQVFVDPAQVANGKVVVTIIGMSPSDTAAAADELGLKAGSKIVAFVRQGELAWWNGSFTYNKTSGSFSYGMKPVLQMIGVPKDSFLEQGSDGLFRFSSRPDQSEAFTMSDLTRLVQEVRSKT